MKNVFYFTLQRYFKCLFCTLDSAPLPLSAHPQAWSLLSFRMPLHIEIQVQSCFLSFSSPSTPPSGLQLIQLVPNLSPYHLLKLHALSSPLPFPFPPFPKGQSGQLSLLPSALGSFVTKSPQDLYEHES